MCPPRAILSALLDNEIEPSVAKKLQAHLEVCPGCKQKYLQLAQLKKILHTDRIKGELAAARRVKKRLNESLFALSLSGWEQSQQMGFWQKRIAVPLPILAGAFLSLLILIASLFFFIGKNHSELQAARSELANLKSIQVYFPVQNPDQLMRFIQNKSISNDIFIELPEANTFQVLGEPTIIYERGE